MTATEKQRFASIARQVGAFLVSVYGILTAQGVAAHLPTWVTAILVAAFPAIELLEHYLGDPSTGTAVATVAQTVAETALPSTWQTTITNVESELEARYHQYLADVEAIKRKYQPTVETITHTITPPEPTINPAPPAPSNGPHA